MGRWRVIRLCRALDGRSAEGSKSVGGEGNEDKRETGSRAECLLKGRLHSNDEHVRMDLASLGLGSGKPAVYEKQSEEQNS